MIRTKHRSILGSTLAMLLLPAVVAAQDEAVIQDEPSRFMGFLQGGVYACCEGAGAGFLGGGGVAATPFSNPKIRILGDGHILGEPGYGAGVYGSGTVAYQGGDPGNDESWLLGAGIGFLTDGNTTESGPQLVLGLGYKAGFVQYRVVRANEFKTVNLLLAGINF